MNSKFLFYFSILLFFAFVSLEAKERQSALTYLNDIRQKSGLITLRSNAQLSKAANAHSKYLVRHQTNGHYEQKGKTGYTGRVPSDRVLRAGYASKSVMENLSVNAGTSKHSIETLFAAIYHRFVFLDFSKDEVGIGSSIGKKSRKISSALVYELGASTINRLCKRTFPKKNGFFYMQNLCKNSANVIPQMLFLQKQDEIRQKNSPVVLYPYPDAVNVPPVFYTEHPHPLPGSLVSGYPVSVQFNPAFYKKVKLKKFRLFDSSGKEIKRKKILSYHNDKNHRFTKLEFALMPLKRLEYAMTYRVEFEALADGKRVRKSWKFTTKKPQGRLYRITKKRTKIKVAKNEKIVLYFVPRNRKDLLGRVTLSRSLHVRYLDQNTLEITLPHRHLAKEYHLKAAGREVILKR